MPAHTHIAIIGAGPAGLAAAETLSARGYRVTVFDRMPSAGRKFLLAGRSGLNLTHNEPLDSFLDRYGSQKAWLELAIRAYPPAAVVAWAQGLGQDCFSGSSGRVFPTVMKASPLLRSWLARLRERGVVFAMQHHWRGWTQDGQLHFETPDGEHDVRPDATILALGGASWARMGADGLWTRALPKEDVAPFQAANCGFSTSLGASFHERYQGQILHSVMLKWADEAARGDVMVTHRGVEGAPIYALSAFLRDAIARDGKAVVTFDLRPAMDEPALRQKIAALRPRESVANKLRRIGMAELPRALLRETTAKTADAAALAHAIKNVPLTLTAPEDIERAISVAGGLRRSAVDDCFMLRARPGVFAAGEMLDWEAPTGGYLLQACFATGVAAALGVESWLTRRAT